MMPGRYNTEIRGDGATRMWTLPHGLDDRKPAVSVHEAANRDASGSVRYAWPSTHEVAITFAEPPPVGALYQIEVATGASACRSRSPTVSSR